MLVVWFLLNNSWTAILGFRRRGGCHGRVGLVKKQPPETPPLRPGASDFLEGSSPTSAGVNRGQASRKGKVAIIDEDMGQTCGLDGEIGILWYTIVTLSDQSCLLCDEYRANDLVSVY